MTNPFRFGVQVNQPVGDMSWADTSRRVEELGYSSLLMPDHFHEQFGPITGLAAAAGATSTLKVGALVFGNDYRHPVVLAKEMATLDVVSEGRVEFGLGAGWMRTDYDEAGFTYDRPGLRIERMQESVSVLAGCLGDAPFSFSGEHYNITDYNGLPKPHQSHIPLIIGGGGKRVLSYAARTADIVGITATLTAGEVGPEAIADSMGAAYDQKLEWVKAAAGDRFDDIELSCLTMAAAVVDAPKETAPMLQGMSELFGVSAEEMQHSPAAIIGTVDEIAELLQARRERWGFSYVVVQSDALESFAPVVARLTGT